ncbi:hypothetical protein Taro_043280 [Colocasia esculenta]|uniref:Small heat shock protein n=1 Tax=Colocasia esculenta TaxID=4460 RepID=A0A843WRP3_COLES|nr:hypothetical protein [Colocasia esculenta]
MASWQCESEVVRRRVNRIASHVAGSEESEVPARHHSQLLPMNCSNTLNSVMRRCDNRLLFARQSSASQSCFMQQVSATQVRDVFFLISVLLPSLPPCSGDLHGGIDIPVQAIPYMPNLKKQQPTPQEYVEPSAEPPRFARPGSGVCDKNQLSCNRTEQTVSSQGSEWSPRMDVAETGQYYIVMLELPGANVLDIKVEVDDRKYDSTL